MSDSITAHAEYEEAANRGDVEAMVVLGVIAVTECDPPDTGRARSWWEKAAEAGNAGAMVNLALLAESSDLADLAEARRWFERAAELGEPSAMMQLGFMALEQEDEPDQDLARSWWEKAANTGHLAAMINLGNLAYESDPPDLDTARTWYEKAAELGDTEAMVQLGFMSLRHETPPDQQSARTWWEKAARAGDSDAMFRLGRQALQDDSPDLADARSWLEKAAEAGQVSAMMDLGFMFARMADPPDPESARKWWERAAATGEVEAMFNLGRLYAMQMDPPDTDTARHWWQKAADTGHVNAMFSLGILFRSMLDVPDLPAARSWLEKAAAAGSEDAADYLHEHLGPSHLKVSDFLRRSGLGKGWYVVRDDGDYPEIDWTIVDALIGAGACAVQHSGMFESTTMAIAFPGGCLYQVISTYGFGGLQEGMWLFGPAAIRQVFRILGYKQPTRKLSGETAIPTVSELQASWEEFAAQEQLERVGLSLGALVWMRMPWLQYGRKSKPDHFEPIKLPIQWSRTNPPPGPFSPMDPQDSDAMFWTAESTTVHDATGTYRLRADGEMVRENERR
jgi:TPR repeat protein